MNNNYDGILDQVIRFINESPDILADEKQLTSALKNRLVIEYHKNKTEYLVKLRNAEEHFNNLFQISINRLLAETHKTENRTSDEYYTPLEIANILHKTKGSVFNWINNGSLKGKQDVKGGKVKIHCLDMNEFVEKNMKYKNLWINR